MEWKWKKIAEEVSVAMRLAANKCPTLGGKEVQKHKVAGKPEDPLYFRVALLKMESVVSLVFR